MIYLGVWFIGVIVTLLAFKWMKEILFRLKFDNDGMKILAALAWPVLIVVELADLITTWADHFVDTYNKRDDTISFKRLLVASERFIASIYEIL